MHYTKATSPILHCESFLDASAEILISLKISSEFFVKIFIQNFFLGGFFFQVFCQVFMEYYRQKNYLPIELQLLR